MSTSSQGAESTPSANSVLSESSLVLQSGDILPEAGLNEAEASGNVYQGMEFKSQAPKKRTVKTKHSTKSFLSRDTVMEKICKYSLTIQPMCK